MTSVDDGWYGTDDVRHVHRCHPSTSWYHRRPILYSMSYFIIFLEFLGLYYRVKRSPKHYCRGLYQFVRFRLIWFVVVSLQRRPRVLIVMHVPACVVAHSLSWHLDVPAIHVWRLSWQFPCTCPGVSVPASYPLPHVPASRLVLVWPMAQVSTHAIRCSTLYLKLRLPKCR